MKCDAGVSVEAKDGRFEAVFAGGDAQYPAFTLAPTSGGAWDLSPWGHVEIPVTNPGAKPVNVAVRVDNAGNWRDSPWNTEGAYLKPGESRTVKVIFGYQYGFKKGYALDPSKVSHIKIFLNGKSAEERRLVLGDLSASGASGEKPPVDPSRIVVKPEGGVIVPLNGGGAKNLNTNAGAAAEFAPDGTLRVDLGAKPDGAVRVKPPSGFWNLNEWLKVTAKVKNTGSAPCTPRVKVDANGEAITVAAEKPVAPGKTAEIVVPFIPAKPWTQKGYGKGVKPEGGTKFESHRVRGVVFSAKEPGAKFEVLSVKAGKVVAKAPAWLGKRPPVPGDWKRTLSEEFDGPALDEKLWSPHSANYWDKRTHFTRDNVLFRDGCAVLKYEKKRGAKNDDPALGETDYACGILDSFGKWAQRYGYFEARMKLPRAPGLWPAFWTMPDKGPAAGKERWMRTDTHKGGMEFDIMEHLTAWGPYRFNIACHWDGYGNGHKSIGSGGVYVPADADGFITVGMLWLPGVWAVYGNGVEVARWESERVADAPAHIFFYMVSGGWANEPLDDDALPDEFAIDWFHVWQLKEYLQ